MGKKKKDKIQIHFTGSNADNVTGSEILITYKDMNILLESGLVQSNSMKDDYIRNSKKLSYKPKDIDVVFCNHIHIDHIGRIPKLYAEGCEATIVSTHESVPFFQPMLMDSAHIMERDSELLSRGGKNYRPIYTAEDVQRALTYVRGYSYNQIHKINDTLSFCWVGSGHIIGSAQLILYIKTDSKQVRKILYTSDLGNIRYPQYYVKDFEPVRKAEIVICEATYANPEKKSASKDAREKDIEKIKTVIDNTCNYDRGRVLMPVFSLQRLQSILTLLYDIYHDDKDFDLPIIVDTPLGVKITKIFEDTLIGEDKEKIHNVIKWHNVRLVTDPKISRHIVHDKAPKIILSSSGMGNNGRVKFYLQEMLPNKRDHIVFTGFATEGSLSARIKNKRFQKYISIDGKSFVNRAGITNITSFSGHMTHLDLLNYYKSFNTSRIYLVHSEQNEKIQFKKILEEELSQVNKTIKVIATNKGMVASL